MSPGHYAHGRRRHAGPRRREHDLVVPTFGVTYTGSLRAGEAAVRRARHAPGRDRARRRHPRRRGQRRLPRAVLRPRHRVGLPAATREVDQHVGPQVRAGAARRRLGRVARRRPSCPTTSSSTSPTSAATCRCSRSTSPGRPARSSPSTTTSSGSDARATAGCTWRPTTPGGTSPSEIVEARTVRAALRQRPADRHPDRHVEADRRRRPGLHALRPRRPAAHPRLAGAGLPADRHARRTSPCSASWSARTSAATWPRSCSTTSATPSPTSTSTRSRSR